VIDASAPLWARALPTSVHDKLIFTLFIYLLRQKAAQHNVIITKIEEKHKKLKKLKYTKIRNDNANHAANETVVHGSVHSSFLE